MCRCSEEAGASYPPRIICMKGNAEPVFSAKKERKEVLAFGGDLKSAFCLAAGERAYLSQYLGDMENFRVYQNFRRELERMKALFGVRPQKLVCDLHPGYQTTRWRRRRLPEADFLCFRYCIITQHAI